VNSFVSCVIFSLADCHPHAAEPKDCRASLSAGKLLRRSSNGCDCHPTPLSLKVSLVGELLKKPPNPLLWFCEILVFFGCE
jgi:hypothetical protein